MVFHPFICGLGKSAIVFSVDRMISRFAVCQQVEYSEYALQFLQCVEHNTALHADLIGKRECFAHTLVEELVMLMKLTLGPG